MNVSEDLVRFQAGVNSMIRRARDSEVAAAAPPRLGEKRYGIVKAVKGGHVPPLLSGLQVRPQSSVKARAE